MGIKVPAEFVIHILLKDQRGRSLISKKYIWLKKKKKKLREGQNSKQDI
jgi:hypothetical protein